MEVGTSRTDARLTVGRTNRRWAKKNRNRWSRWSDYYEIPIKYPCELLRPMSWPSQLWHRCISAESRWCRGISQSCHGSQGSRRPCARCSRCSIEGSETHLHSFARSSTLGQRNSDEGQAPAGAVSIGRISTSPWYPGHRDGQRDRSPAASVEDSARGRPRERDSARIRWGGGAPLIAL